MIADVLRFTTWWSLDAALRWMALQQIFGTVEEGAHFLSFGIEGWTSHCEIHSMKILTFISSLGEAGLESPGSTCPGAEASQVLF